MAKATVLGVEIDVTDDLATPLGVVLVVKALDAAGEVAYFMHKTDDVSRVEAVGMLIMASDEFRASLAEIARESS